MADEDDLYDDLYDNAVPAQQDSSSSVVDEFGLDAEDEQQPQQGSNTTTAASSAMPSTSTTTTTSGSGSFIPAPSQPIPANSGSTGSSFIPPAAKSSHSSTSFIPPSGSAYNNSSQQQPYQQQHQQQQQYNQLPPQQQQSQAPAGTGQPAPIPTMTSSTSANTEDGKMFVGGLSWQTTDDSLRNYFSQFGKVLDCNIMKDNQGTSRGFGFLKFADPKAVNTIMVREHWLDGKVIDPKRAIPRDTSMRSSKIFVGGIPAHTTNESFRATFLQFGNILDHNLMYDKETGNLRGFGFITFENEESGRNALASDGQVLLDGKMVDVRRATSKNAPGTNQDGNANNTNNNNNRRNNPQQNFNSGNGGDMSGMFNPMMMAGAGGMDVNAMSQMFQQQGWGTGAWNPAMMQQMLMASQAAGSGGAWNPMMMGMNPAMMGMGMGGMGGGGGDQANNNWMGASGGGPNNAMQQQNRGFAGRQQQQQQGGNAPYGQQQQRRHGQAPGMMGNGRYQQQQQQQPGMSPNAGGLRTPNTGLPTRPSPGSEQQRGASQERQSRAGSIGGAGGDAYKRERSPDRRGSNSGGGGGRYEERALR